MILHMKKMIYGYLKEMNGYYWKKIQVEDK